MTSVKDLFSNPTHFRQRQYEALRAVGIEGLSISDAAKKFNYKKSTLYSLVRDIKSGKQTLFFQSPSEKTGRHTPKYITELVIQYRKSNLSSLDIATKIKKEGYKISMRTVERILLDAGQVKLNRRTQAEKGLTLKSQTIPQRASAINYDKLEPFSYDLPVAGIFFFIPYIIDSGVIDIVKECELPKSSVINETEACLSMLLLKLIGSERLSHINNFNHDPGLSLFANLTMLPKSSYMTSYSCRTSEEMILTFQEKIIKRFYEHYPFMYESSCINIDFHSIPHFGTESQMEKVWVGAKHQVMKGANTLMAQDSESNVILYTRSDILRKNESTEIKNFISYWKGIKNCDITETLVFDCKLTNYKILDELNRENIKFITLRKRTKQLIKSTLSIEDKCWQNVYIPIPKRKHKICSVLRV